MPITNALDTAAEAHPVPTTKAGSHANRNAGFIRQAGEWHWGCRMNPAFRWWCQDAPEEPRRLLPPPPSSAELPLLLGRKLELDIPEQSIRRDADGSQRSPGVLRSGDLRDTAHERGLHRSGVPDSLLRHELEIGVAPDPGDGGENYGPSDLKRTGVPSSPGWVWHPCPGAGLSDD